MSGIPYHQFAQYFIEIADYLTGLEKEAEELQEKGEAVPQTISNELYRHQVILSILTQAGEEMYNKNPKQLYQDGKLFAK